MQTCHDLPCFCNTPFKIPAGTSMLQLGCTSNCLLVCSLLHTCGLTIDSPSISFPISPCTWPFDHRPIPRSSICRFANRNKLHEHLSTQHRHPDLDADNPLEAISKPNAFQDFQPKTPQAEITHKETLLYNPLRNIQDAPVPSRKCETNIHVCKPLSNNQDAPSPSALHRCIFLPPLGLGHSIIVETTMF